MPVDVIVLYATPDDPAAFDEHYTHIHIPLARAMPYLECFEVSAGPVDVQGGPSCHLVARLGYASHADLEASLASPEGQSAVADLANFAQAGAILVTAEMRAVEQSPTPRAR